MSNSDDIVKNVEQDLEKIGKSGESSKSGKSGKSGQSEKSGKSGRGGDKQGMAMSEYRSGRTIHLGRTPKHPTGRSKRSGRSRNPDGGKSERKTQSQRDQTSRSRKSSKGSNRSDVRIAIDRSSAESFKDRDLDPATTSKRQKASEAGRSVKEKANEYNNTVLGRVIWATLNVVPIGMILVGSLNFENCPIEPMIPLWLIIGGCLYLVSSLLDIIAYCSKDQNRPLAVRIVDSILIIAMLGWLVAGSTWVYSRFNSVEYSPAKGRELYCDKTTYLLAFISITITYSLIITIICCCCFVTFIAILIK